MASIFSQILQGTIPGHFVWKDERAFAIMTIAPLRPGHLLVIPNQEVNHWDDVDSETASHLMAVAQYLAKALKIAFPAKRVGLAIAGLEVPHTHLHVFPLNELTDFNFKGAQPASQEDLAAAAKRIRDALSELGLAHGC
jgi:diadenosine tetraphosphate (Ap4A) HIT family hydrolase